MKNSSSSSFDIPKESLNDKISFLRLMVLNRIGVKNFNTVVTVWLSEIGVASRVSRFVISSCNVEGRLSIIFSLTA